MLKLPRLKLARFIRIISGHNSLFYFRSKVDNEINPQCRFCLEEDETFDHLLNACPRFNSARREIFQGDLIINNHEWSIQKLIDFSFLPGIDQALQGDTSLRWYGLQDGDSSYSEDEPTGIG